MDTDSLLMPYCDLSGECMIFRKCRPNVYGEPVYKPLITKEIMDLLDYHLLPSTSAIARAVFFKTYPEIDLRCSITMTCSHPCCVRNAHIARGTLNIRSPRKKKL